VRGFGMRLALEVESKPAPLKNARVRRPRSERRRLTDVAAEPPRAGLAGGMEVAANQGGVDEVADAYGQGDYGNGGAGPGVGFVHDGGD
jgi:hypothetical protein